MSNNQSIPQTRSNLDKVSIVGHVIGVKKSSFLRTGINRDGNKWNSLSFGIEISKDHIIYVEMFGTQTKEVYAYKPSTGAGKGETKRIPWASRNEIPEGFRLIGATLNIGTDKDGNKNTIVKTKYDACEILAKLLQDDMLVRANGNLKFQTYKSRDGNVITNTRYDISYLSTNVNLPEDMSRFNPATWSQNFIITGIDKPEEGDDRYTVSVTHIGYNTLNHSEIYTKNAILARSIERALRKGQFACECYGMITVIADVPDKAEVSETDEWGDENPTTAGMIGSVERYLLMTGCDGKNADYETYTEQNVREFAELLDANKSAKETFKDTSATKIKASDEDDDWGSDKDSSELDF